jgi:antitoxin VapB
MPLNIKDPVTERLASDVANLTGESKTGAIRTALAERKQRLLLARGGRERGDRVVELLRQTIWPNLPAVIRGRALTKAEEEALLGFGPDGA